MKATLETRSSISLIQPNLLKTEKPGRAVLPITCVHGDTRYVPAHTVTISAVPGSWTMQVGVLKDLPVPLLLVQDWSGLDRLLWPQPSSEQPTTRRPPRKVCSHPVYLATESDREGESQNENLTVYSDLFQQVRQGGSFAKEQLEDDQLKHCWGQVRVVEDKEHLPGPHPSPHFVVQNGLLYFVANRRGEESHLLGVQQTKTELVMELAHSHPMAGHLGAANTLRDHFHWL